MRIVLLPLRERREDIAMLALISCRRSLFANSLTVRGFVPETMALLERSHWPGNVRELENVIERTMIAPEAMSCC